MQLSSSVVSLADIRAVLESDLLSLAASAAGFGLLSHVSLFHTNFPVEDYLFILLALYVVAVLSTAYAYLTLTQFSVAQALLRVILISSAFNTGLISSIGIYRLFFHRLHHFPGPVGAKISRFYNAYLAGKDLQYNVEIARLHQEYGDFIRTGNPPLVTYPSPRPSGNVFRDYRSTRGLHCTEVRHTFALWATVQMQ